jgi:uncharacterized membrane protein
MKRVTRTFELKDRMRSIEYAIVCLSLILLSVIVSIAFVSSSGKSPLYIISGVILVIIPIILALSAYRLRLRFRINRRENIF